MAKQSDLKICDEAIAIIQKVIDKKLHAVEELKTAQADMAAIREEIIAGTEVSEGEPK